MKKQSCFVSLLMLLLLFPLGAFAQQQMIKGQVVDDSGESIIGATIMVKGAKEGTLTDFDGNFSLKGKVGTTLSISYVGYSPLEVKVKKLEGNRFVLREDAKVLDEVVVVGMDKQKRSTITAAVATVSSEAIASRPVTDLTSALQGNVAGLNFSTDAVADGVGGEMGAEIKFNIRGTGSINKGEPYVLIDGVEQSLQNVNPNDIETISILKDASAAAVYGARAAYGVIIVTTKSGGKDKTRVSYNGTVGFSSPINMPKMMNSLEFAHYINERNDNDGKKHEISDALIEKMEGFMKNPYSTEFPGIEPNQNKTNWASSKDAVYANTDWFDYYFKDASIRHSHNLSISGGSDKVSYYVGLGYIYQEGLMDKVDDNLSKYNVNTKFQINANKWLKFNFNNNLTLNILKRPMANQTIFYGTIGQTIPNAPTHYPIESKYNDASEFRYLKESHYVENRISDAMSFSATITPLQGWDIVGEMKVRFDVEDNSFKRGYPTYEKPDGELSIDKSTKQGYVYPGMNWKNSRWGSYTRGNAFDYYLSPNILSSYIFGWGDHTFRAMAGFQMELQENSDGYTYKDGLLTSDIFSFANANGNLSGNEDRTHWATMGMYAKLNWNYQEVYFLEFSGRYDGSSRFAPGHRWGFFPSVSLGWNLTNEKFMNKRPNWLTTTKIRLSWGKNGNENIGNFKYTVLTSPGNNAIFGSSENVINGVKASGLANPDLKWEESEQLDFGLDFGFFNNALTFTADYYKKKTNGMLMEMNIPFYVGEAKPIGNVGKMENSGIELEAAYKFRVSDWNFRVSANASYLKNKLIEYGNESGWENLDSFQGTGDISRAENGKPFPFFYGYKTAGIFQNTDEVKAYKNDKGELLQPTAVPGDVRFVDVDGNGIIDANDRTDIGKGMPDWTFGFNLGVSWKNFDLNMMWQGTAGNDIYDATRRADIATSNLPSWMLNRWTGEGTSNRIPRFVQGDNVNWQSSDLYVYDGSYLRLKNIQLGYTLPAALTQKVFISSLRFYVAAENLFTFTKYHGFDPEISSGGTSLGIDYGVYPQARVWTIGASLSF